MESSENTYLNGYSQFQQVKAHNSEHCFTQSSDSNPFLGVTLLPSTSSAVFCKVQVTGLLVFIYIPGVADTVA